jgi:hypothetical protein
MNGNTFHYKATATASRGAGRQARCVRQGASWAGIGAPPAAPIQPPLIVIGSDTAPMLARNERSDALLHKICQRNMRGRFRRLSVIGKSGRDADLGKTTLLTDAVEKGLVIFGEQ